MPERSSFDYAIIRVVPSIERGECINVGVILFNREARFLDARVEVDWDRLLTLAPDVDCSLIERQLDHLVRVARGEANGGPIARLDPSQRFHWLTGPRSTTIQVSETHSGLCDEPERMLEHLLDTIVRTKAKPAPQARDAG